MLAFFDTEAHASFFFFTMCAGTLLVKDGSHSSHEDFFQNATVLTEEQKQKTEDFYKFQDQEREYFRKFENKALSAKAGSLFLWDSRCAHQNLLPGNGKPQCCFMEHDASSQMWGMGCTWRELTCVAHP